MEANRLMYQKGKCLTHACREAKLTIERFNQLSQGFKDYPPEVLPISRFKERWEIQMPDDTTPTLQFELRDYQQTALELIEENTRKQLLVAPTGSGKGAIIAAAMVRFPDTVVTVPTPDIARGVLRYLVGDVAFELSRAQLRRECESRGLYSAKRYLNLFEAGLLPTPSRIIHDEGHHAIADTYARMHEYYGHTVPTTLLTATPYRGTPKGTAELIEMVDGNVHVLLTERDAVERGFVALPDFVTWPLVNDELISIVNGEFDVTVVTEHTSQAIPALIKRTVDTYYNPHKRRWAAPITIVMPSVDALGYAAETLARHEALAEQVIASTRNRNEIFQRVLDRKSLLLQVAAVGEGTDIAFRIMIDASPTMSPVVWRQRVGRLTRPGGESVYIGCNHNMMRHGYLLDGLIPPVKFKDHKEAWQGEWQPSRRTVARALGLTGFGKFQPEEITLANGNSVFMYMLRTKDNWSYACILLPWKPNPIWFHRHDANGTWGKWKRIPQAPEIDKAVSYPKCVMTPKQEQWWKNCAKRCHLDDTILPNAKQFQIMPLCLDVGGIPEFKEVM